MLGVQSLANRSLPIWALWLGFLVRGIGWTAAIILGGLLIGAVISVIGGTLLGMGRPLDYLLAKGAANGSFYALIWAPGLSIVICIMQAHQLAQAKKSATPSPSRDR